MDRDKIWEERMEQDKYYTDVLVKDGIISEDDLSKALKTQRESRKGLGGILIDMGLTTEMELPGVLGKRLGVPFLVVSNYIKYIEPEVFALMPYDIMLKHGVIPVDKTANTVTIAIADPSSSFIAFELKYFVKGESLPILSFATDIQEALDFYEYLST